MGRCSGSQQKLELVEGWLKDNWKVSLYDLRKEVQTRQYATYPDGTFKKDQYGRLVNKLTEPSDTDPSKTVMEELVEQVNVFKSLQPK